MNKKIISLLIFLFLGSLIFIQSCNESPIVSSYNENVSFQNDPNFTERLISYKFENYGLGLPVKCPGQSPTNPETRVTLWGHGGTFEVGWVEFDQYIPASGIGTPDYDSAKLHVVYHFDYGAEVFPWRITKIHFHIGDMLSDIPHNSGGPIPEKCNYQFSGPDTIKTGTHSFWYNLPEDKNYDGYYVLAHAEGCHFGGIEGFNFYLPNHSIKYHVVRNGTQSYHKITFLNGTGGILGAGPYESFCVDPDLHIYPPVTLTGQIYSSYEPLPEYLQNDLENWENLDLVNWIINYYPLGSSVQQRNYSIPWTTAAYPFAQNNFSAPVGTGTVKWEDIQAAIWALLDTEPVYNSWNSIQNNLTQSNAWGILYDVLYGGNHNGFIPGCNQKVIAILNPNETTNSVQLITIQPVISQLQLPCVTHCGSISGDGKYGATYPGSSSSYTYFRWDLQCSGMP